MHVAPLSAVPPYATPTGATALRVLAHQLFSEAFLEGHRQPLQAFLSVPTMHHLYTLIIAITKQGYCFSTWVSGYGGLQNQVHLHSCPMQLLDLGKDITPCK